MGPRDKREDDNGTAVNEAGAPTRIAEPPPAAHPGDRIRLEERPLMSLLETHRATLNGLNRNYIRSVDEADVAWFDKNLAEDFLNTNPDGSIIDRTAFLAQIGRGSTVRDIQEQDVVIRIFGPHAIIHARTSYLKPDGSRGGGRYTDDWHLIDGRWQCVSAHITRL
jgi:hypothetical protein